MLASTNPEYIGDMLDQPFRRNGYQQVIYIFDIYMSTFGTYPKADTLPVGWVLC